MNAWEYLDHWTSAFLWTGGILYVLRLLSRLIAQASTSANTGLSVDPAAGRGAILHREPRVPPPGTGGVSRSPNGGR